MPNHQKHPKKIIFLRPGKLGDMIVLTPILKALKETLPELVVVVAASPANEIIIRHNQNCSRIISINYHSILQVISLIIAIRKACFDWVIDTTPGNSTTSSIIARLVKTKHTKIAAMHKTKRLNLYDCVANPHGLHIIDRNKALVEKALSINLGENLTIDIAFTSEYSQKADEILLRFPQKPFLIGINCSAGKEDRQWPLPKYEKLIEAVGSQFPSLGIILFGVGNQYVWACEFSKGKDYCMAFPKSHFLTVVAAIKHLKALFTPDTSLLHVAAGFKVPLTVLYPDSLENLLRWKAYQSASHHLCAPSGGVIADISSEKASEVFIGQIHSILKEQQ